MDGAPDARARAGLRPGRERARCDQHGPRRGGDRCPRPRLVVEPGHQPDGRGDELPGRLRAADRPRQRHARRTGSRQHRALAVRLLPGDEGPRPRRLPRTGARTVLDRRGRRADRGRLRDRRALPDAGDDPRRRGHGPGDGAGRPGLSACRLASPEAGSSPGPTAARRGSSAPSTSEARTSRRTTATCSRSSRRSPSARSAGRASSSTDAEIVIVAYGTAARVARTAIERAREQGLRVGLFRPITLWPFPSSAAGEHRGGDARHRRPRDVGRTDGRGRAAGCRGTHARSSSTAARAAWSRHRPRSWTSCGAPGR